MTLTIKTNNVPRDILTFWELTAKEAAEFDYLTPDEGSFFRYRGNVYDLGEFMRCPDEREASNLAGWHGYSSDSFFSGVVVRYVDDHERVVVGTYYS